MPREGDARSGRSRWLALVAMTLANSMILVDQTAVPLAVPELVQDLGGSISEGPWILTANILPLAALMVFGGRLGDLAGLRRVFLLGALVFTASSAMAGAAQSMPWAIAARAAQGAGAALMMPTALAIISSIFPRAERGRALGILAGASAFFAALGPVLGGLLAAADWRLVFLVNVPLAAAAILLTLSAVPRLDPDPDAPRDLDYPGILCFGLGIAALVFGLTQGQDAGWDDVATLVALGTAALMLVAFPLVEQRTSNPLIEFRLFRHLNFLASNISQVLAGMVELGMGFLLPAYLLLIIGVSPAVAGLALIPATVPIILAGPVAGRMFDRVGGRGPLVVGFLVLAASGVALALAVPERSYPVLIPGLVLQGIGLGVILTVNDPTGLTAVPRRDQGQAAGMINTAEQMGGALGIAGLSAVLLDYYRHLLFEKLAARGIDVTPGDVEQAKEFILQVEQRGREQTDAPGRIGLVLDEILDAHVSAYELTFFVAAGLAALGALACLVLVRRLDRVSEGPLFSRRSRWVYAAEGRSPAVTREPPEAIGGSG